MDIKAETIPAITRIIDILKVKITPLGYLRSRTIFNIVYNLGILDDEDIKNLIRTQRETSSEQDLIMELFTSILEYSTNGIGELCKRLNEVVIERSIDLTEIDDNNISFIEQIVRFGIILDKVGKIAGNNLKTYLFYYAPIFKKTTELYNEYLKNKANNRRDHEVEEPSTEAIDDIPLEMSFINDMEQNSIIYALGNLSELEGIYANRITDLKEYLNLEQDSSLIAIRKDMDQIFIETLDAILKAGGKGQNSNEAHRKQRTLLENNKIKADHILWTYLDILYQGLNIIEFRLSYLPRKSATIEA